MSTSTRTERTDLYDTISPASVAAEVVKIERRLTALEQSVRDTRLMVAAQLDALAEDIGYPINDIAKTRKHIRDLAAKLRAGTRHG